MGRPPVDGRCERIVAAALMAVNDHVCLFAGNWKVMGITARSASEQFNDTLASMAADGGVQKLQK